MPPKRKKPLTELEIEARKKRKSNYDRLRRQRNEETNSIEETESFKEKDRERQRLRRQDNNELDRKQNTEKQRLRRQKKKDDEKKGLIHPIKIKTKYQRLLESERENGYDPDLEMMREKNRIRSKKKYHENSQKLCEESEDQDETGVNAKPSTQDEDLEMVKGETMKERRNRLRRERAHIKRQSDPSSLQHVTKNVPSRIKNAVEKTLLTLTEIHSKKRIPENYESLEPQLAEKWCFKELLVQELRCKFNFVRMDTCVEALELELGPDIPDAETPNYPDPLFSKEIQRDSDSWKRSKRWDVLHSIADPTPDRDAPRIVDPLEGGSNSFAHNRWDRIVERDSGDVENNVIDTFNNIQIKIEREEEPDEQESVEDARNEKEVREWIARIISEDTEEARDNDVQIISRKITSINDKSQENVNEIFSASTVQEKTSRLTFWKARAIQEIQIQKLKKLQEKFKAARNRWISEKPDEHELRDKVDAERTKLKEEVIKEKLGLLELARLELARKRNFYSKETLEERNQRISSEYEKERQLRSLPLPDGNASLLAKINKNRKTVERRVREGLTPEQIKTINADRARMRLKCERGEYDIYNALVEVASSTSEREVVAEDLSKFESILVQEDNRKVIKFFGEYKGFLTDQHIVAYRKLLYDLLSLRVLVKEIESDPDPSRDKPTSSTATFHVFTDLDPIIQEELIPISEAQSRKDFEEVKTFIAKHGEIIKKHVTFKRFYMTTHLKKKILERTPEQQEKARIISNAAFRKRYHKKKFGLNTKLGDYLKTRDPTKRNNKLDQPRPKSQKAAPLASPQRKKAPATKTFQRKRKSKPQEVEQDSDSEESLKEVPDPTDSYSTYNNNEFSNSGDGFTDCGADDGSNEMWTPSASVVEVNSSVIPQELINLATGVSPYFQQHNQQLNNQNQYTTLGFQQLQMSQNLTYSYQMPQLQLITPVNQSVPYLQNNQLDMLAHVSSNQHMPQLWNAVPSSSTATQRSILESFQQTQTQTNVTSEYGDNAGYSSSSSSTQSLPSPPKQKRGRPKGFKVTRSKNRNIALSQNVLQKAKRDIWNNRKRRKYYEKFGRPETVKDAISIAVASIISHPPVEQILEETFESVRENFKASIAQNQEFLLPKCLHCDKICTGEEELEKHIKKFHGGKVAEPTKENVDLNGKKFQCKSCLSHLSGPYRLIQHIFHKHYEAKRHICPFSFKRKCYDNKFDKYGLTEHIRRSHSKEVNISFIMGATSRHRVADAKKFLCLRCDAVFDSYSKLHDHYSKTHGKIRYCCIHCGIYLREEDFWKDHIKLHHPEKKHGPPQPLEIDENDMHRCKTCFSEFSSESFLKDHISQGHTWLKNDDSKHEKIACTKCAKEFGTVYARDLHSKRLCNSLGQVCYWCKRKFESEELLKEHLIEFHPLEAPIPDNFEDTDYFHAPYKCEICRRSYMNLSSCRRHAVTQHQLIEVLEKMKAKGQVMEKESSAQFSQNQNKDPIVNSKENKTVSVDKPLQNFAKTLDNNDALKKLFTCPKCPLQATAKDFHHLHLSYDKVMKKYCAQCDRVFSRSIVLTQHREAAHGLLKDSWKNPPNIGKMGPIPQGVKPEDWHSCEVCSLGLTSEEVHSCHLWSDKDSEVRNCPHCSEKFYSSDNYNNHLHVVHQVPLNMKMSIKKPEDSLKKREIIRHNFKVNSRELTPEDYDKLIAVSNVKTSTGEMKIFSCKVCLNKSFKSDEFIKKHIEDNHKEDAFTRVACKECCCTFASIGTLSKHQKTNHQQKLTRFKCPFCETTFMRKDHLKDHVKSKHASQAYSNSDIKIVPVTEDMGFFCSICSRMTKTKEGLKSHMTNVHFPIHFSTFCDVCGLQINPSTLKAHLETHSGTVKSGLAIEKGPIKRRLNLMEAAELIKDVYDQVGISYNMKFGKVKSKKEKSKSLKRPRKSKPRKPSNKNEKEDPEFSESSGNEENEFFVSYSSSSEDENDIFFSAMNDESSGNEEDVSLKDILIKPIKVKKGITPTKSKRQTTRKSVKSSEKDNYSEEDDNNDKDYNENAESAPDSELSEENGDIPYKSQNTAPKRKRLTRKSTAPSQKPIYKDDDSDFDELEPKRIKQTRNVTQKISSSQQMKPQSTPVIDESKKLVILLERCDEQVAEMIPSQMVVDTPNTVRKCNCIGKHNHKRKVPESSPSKSRKWRPNQIKRMPSTCRRRGSKPAPKEVSFSDEDEIVIKEEIFDELEIEPEPEMNQQTRNLPSNEFDDIERELDSFVLYNYGF